jgi:hypothetical protein
LAVVTQLAFQVVWEIKFDGGTGLSIAHGTGMKCDTVTLDQFPSPSCIGQQAPNRTQKDDHCGRSSYVRSTSDIAAERAAFSPPGFEENQSPHSALVS